MPTIELTTAQADALRRAALEEIEWTEEQFRSGGWQEWDDEVARKCYDDIARLLECIDILLPAVLCDPKFSSLVPAPAQEATNAND